MKKIIQTILFLTAITTLLLTACGQSAPTPAAPGNTAVPPAGSTAVPTAIAAKPTQPAGATPQGGKLNLNPEQRKSLNVLSQGIEAWNTWRRNNKDVKSDLSGLMLRNLPLKRINFKDTLLVGTDLRGANLSHSNLSGADLTNADLTHVDLRGTDLTDAKLTGAILTGATYNKDTKWPTGFDPAAAGATLIQ